MIYLSLWHLKFRLWFFFWDGWETTPFSSIPCQPPNFSTSLFFFLTWNSNIFIFHNCLNKFYVSKISSFMILLPLPFFILFLPYSLLKLSKKNFCSKFHAFISSKISIHWKPNPLKTLNWIKIDLLSPTYEISSIAHLNDILRLFKSVTVPFLMKLPHLF